MFFSGNVAPGVAEVGSLFSQLRGSIQKVVDKKRTGLVARARFLGQVTVLQNTFHGLKDQDRVFQHCVGGVVQCYIILRAEPRVEITEGCQAPIDQRQILHESWRNNC